MADTSTLNFTQVNPALQDITLQKSNGYIPDSEMNKRHTRFFYDPHDMNNGQACCSRFPKCSFFLFRRSWNFKLLIIAATSLTFVLCFYSGIFSDFVPSMIPKLSPQGYNQVDSPKRNLRSRYIGQDAALKSQDYNIQKGEKRYPSSIIFGVSKCGTRAILEYLKLHPDVVAPVAEINFFNEEELFKRGVKWYLNQMPFARNHQIVVEKSPDYFQNPDCAPMIRLMNSNVKLLLLLRDPVERLVSQYMQLLDKNPNLPKFENWVIDKETNKINLDVRSVLVSAYSKYLETWLSVFPREQILIVESDDLRKHPFTEMKRVERFLNLEPFFQPTDFYFNSTRGFYCLRHRTTERIKCLGKSKGRTHIPVDGDVLDILNNFYKPYNKRLTELIGKRFPWT